MKHFPLGAFLLLSSVAHANDAHWPCFRGPDGNGIAPATKVPSAITADHIRWSTELPGGGHSSPVVWGKRIFLTCDDTDQERRSVTCFDSDTGKLVWSKWFPCKRYRVHRDNSFAAATPSVDADGVYLSWVTAGNVEALALNHEGEILWQRNLGAFEARHGPGGSATLVGNVLVVPNDQESADAALHGLDRKTGRKLWSVKRDSGNPSYATPPVYRNKAGDKRLIICSPANGLSGINPKSGAPDWAVKELFSLNVVTSPVIVGNHIFASAGRGGSREAAVVSFSDDGSAKILYRPADDIPYVPTPVAIGGNIFLWDDRGTASCLDMKTGKVVWSKRVAGPTYTSPVSDGKRIFGIDRKGELVVISATTKHEELGRFQLPEGTHATPAIAHESLFIRTFNKLLRINS